MEVVAILIVVRLKLNQINMLRMSFNTDITVVMTVYDRHEYICWSIMNNKIGEFEVLLVADGSDEQVLSKIKECQTKYQVKNINLIAYYPNRGVSYAKSLGIKKVRTPYFMFCDDDDYIEKFSAFYEEAKGVVSNNTLFVPIPEIVAFGKMPEKIQYDRRVFHNKTGCELLEYIVRTGEIHTLCAGTCFRTADVLPLLPEPFFRVSEDFVLLARLCARYPERRIYVANSGRYMRRIHSQSLSNPSQITPEKMLMHIVSLVVGGYYLEKMGRSNRAEFVRILLNRGKLLQRIYGFGLQTAALVGGLLLDRPFDPRAAEAVHALNYLRAHRDVLPPELMAMLSDVGKSMLMAS